MRIIDCDSHFLTCDIYKNIEEQYQKLLPRYIFDSENRVVDVQFDKDPCVIKDPSNIFHSHCRELGMNNLDIRIADFKKLKIDMQLLAPQERGMRFNYAVEKNLAAAMAHSYNIEIKKRSEMGEKLRLQVYKPKHRVRVSKEEAVPFLARLGGIFVAMGGVISFIVSSMIVSVKGFFHVKKKLDRTRRGKYVEMKIKKWVCLIM